MSKTNPSLREQINNIVDNIYLCGENGRSDVSDGYKTGLINLIDELLSSLKLEKKDLTTLCSGCGDNFDLAIGYNQAVNEINTKIAQARESLI